MTTYKRICIKDFEIRDSIGQTLSLKRGEEYLTSNEEEGKVMILSKFWVVVPAEIFAGELRYT